MRALTCLFHLAGDSGTSARQLLTSCLGSKTLEDSHAEGNAIGIKSSANRYNRRITAQVADFINNMVAIEARYTTSYREQLGIRGEDIPIWPFCVGHGRL